jgi:hypothetical protein
LQDNGIANPTLLDDVTEVGTLVNQLWSAIKLVTPPTISSADSDKSHGGTSFDRAAYGKLLETIARIDEKLCERQRAPDGATINGTLKLLSCTPHHVDLSKSLAAAQAAAAAAAAVSTAAFGGAGGAAGTHASAAEESFCAEDPVEETEMTTWLPSEKEILKVTNALTRAFGGALDNVPLWTGTVKLRTVLKAMNEDERRQLSSSLSQHWFPSDGTSGGPQSRNFRSKASHCLYSLLLSGVPVDALPALTVQKRDAFRLATTSTFLGTVLTIPLGMNLLTKAISYHLGLLHTLIETAGTKRLDVNRASLRTFRKAVEHQPLPESMIGSLLALLHDKSGAFPSVPVLTAAFDGLKGVGRGAVGVGMKRTATMAFAEDGASSAAEVPTEAGTTAEGRDAEEEERVVEKAKCSRDVFKMAFSALTLLADTGDHRAEVIAALAPLDMSLPPMIALMTEATKLPWTKQVPRDFNAAELGAAVASFLAALSKDPSVVSGLARSVPLVDAAAQGLLVETHLCHPHGVAPLRYLTLLERLFKEISDSMPEGSADAGAGARAGGAHTGGAAGGESRSFWAKRDTLHRAFKIPDPKVGVHAMVVEQIKHVGGQLPGLMKPIKKH